MLGACQLKSSNCPVLLAEPQSSTGKNGEKDISSFFLFLSLLLNFGKKKKYGMENIHSKKIKRKRKHGTRENMRTRAFGYNSAKCSQQFEFFFLVEKKN